MYSRHTYRTGTRQPPQSAWGRTRVSEPVAIVTAMLLTLVAPHLAQGKTFHCGATDVSCLIAAITESVFKKVVLSEPHRVILRHGTPQTIPD
jgi:hypothetical protein